VPPGLGQLSASLRSLADFLRIDKDLLHVAAQGSDQMDDVKPKPDELRSWLGDLPAAEKDGIIASLITGEDPALAAELLQRFLKHRNGEGSRKHSQPDRRTVGELLNASETYSEEQRRIEDEKRAEEKKQREIEAAAARAKYLCSIAGSERKLWADVEELIATKQPRNYDRVLKLLEDLRDLAEREKSRPEFNARLEALHAAHTRKPTLIERLRKAGM
jgi:hypothetical protein